MKIKNHTHVKKMGHTSEFPFGIYWWTLKNLKNQNFEKMKKNCWRYHHFTHVYQSHNHMRYSSWDTEWDRIFLSFWTILLFFYSLPPNNPKREMSSFSTCATKNMTIWCMLTQICSGVDIIFCHFRPFFALLHHCWPQKLKFGKTVKNAWIYYPFTHVYHKSRLHEVWFLRYKVQRTEFFVI